MKNNYIMPGKEISIEIDIMPSYLSFTGVIKKIEDKFMVVAIEGSYVQNDERQIKGTISNGNKVCIFETIIKGCIENQLILVMPKNEDLQILQRRKYVRIPVDLEVVCFLVGYNGKKIYSNKKFLATVKNISGGGVLLNSSLSVPIGTVLVLELILDNKLFILTAKVVRNTRNTTNRSRDLGCEFLGISDGDRQKIIAFSNKMQLKMNHKKS